MRTHLGKLFYASALALTAMSIQALQAADVPIKAAVYKKAAAPYFVPHWYVEGRFGTGLDPNFDFTINPGGATGTYAPSSGRVGAFAIGRYFTPNWRWEAELIVGRGAKGAALGLAHTGSFVSYLVMANALYSFNTGWRLEPFVGAGLGAMILTTNNLGAVGGAFALNDTDAAIAASIIAGLDYRLGRNWTATLRYTGVFAGSTTHATTAAGVTVDVGSSYTSLLTVGARYTF